MTNFDTNLTRYQNFVRNIGVNVPDHVDNQVAYVNAAVARLDMKRNPFHPFSSFDTATLAGLAYGQTVLAKACQAAGIDFDGREAHSARYDTEKTADLFCGIVNRWKQMGGWEDFSD